jgi:hypothetical protein
VVGTAKSYDIQPMVSAGPRVASPRCREKYAFARKNAGVARSMAKAIRNNNSTYLIISIAIQGAKLKTVINSL